MQSTPQHEVTRLLQEWKQGDGAALGALVPLVETELRRLAANLLRRERPGHTLQPTALVNEAWLRLARDGRDFESRSHFVSIAAHCMRQILVDHARRKQAGKRGAGEPPAQLDLAQLSAPESSAAMLALDDGLNELARLQPRHAQVVELHFFGGLTYDEIAGFLNIGRSTVLRDLRMAEMWLKHYITA